jgi:menaquinone-dependent protoporphyrinogen oxidase
MTTRVLVTVASRHGATTAIGDAICRTLVGRGLDVTALPPEQVGDVTAYDAVVLGSAVYMGRWLDPAKRFVERYGDALGERPVWLFSSGPIGDPPKPAGDPPEVAAVVERLGARGHEVFNGRLDRSRLGFSERLIVKGVKAPDGDFRDWEVVRTWADGIATALGAAAAALSEAEPVGV